jgi:hypothetical protein
MKMTSYRLDRYKIIEIQGGDVWWETHAYFARTKSGRCFIEGNVLFLEPYSEVSEPGFLIMEYDQSLDKLPPWTGTKFYCAGYTLRSCHTGDALSERKVSDLLKVWKGRPLISTDKIKSAWYRMGRYEIYENEKRELLWKAYDHLDNFEVGKGFIEGMILFLEAGEVTEIDLSETEFLNQLDQRPLWERTPFYSTRYTLRACHADKTTLEKSMGKPLREGWERIKNNVSIQNKLKDRIRSPKTAETKALIKSYGSQLFKLIVLAAGLLFALSAAFFSFLVDQGEKIVARCYKKYVDWWHRK